MPVLVGIGARWHILCIKINIVFEILWFCQCFRNSFEENEHLNQAFQKKQKQPYLEKLKDPSQKNHSFPQASFGL